MESTIAPNSNFFGKSYLEYKRSLHQLVKIVNQKLNHLDEKIMHRENRTRVKLYASFLKVGEIATWEDNSIKEDSFDAQIHWTPSIFVENKVGSIQEKVEYKITTKGKRKFVSEKRSIKGLFYETLELNDFPLDIQDISITITTSKSDKEVLFVPSNEQKSTINTDEFRAQQEWILYPYINTSKKSYYDIFENYSRPAISFQVLLTMLGFMPFSFAVSSPSSRTGSTVMLILSSINFKIAVTTRLPTVSYLTILDKYALPALIYMGILCAYHAFIGSTLFSSLSLSNLSRIDQFCLSGFGALFLSFHLIYFTYFVFKLLRQKQVKAEEKKEAEQAEKYNLKKLDSDHSLIFKQL